MRSKFFYVLVSLALAPCAYSQVGIGTIAPDNSAQLEVKANNRGVLIPRIALKSITQQLSSAKNAKSLLIFNSKEFKDPNDSVTYSEGYYYWDGERWVRLLRGADLSGALGNVTLQGDVTGPLNNTKMGNFINKPVDTDANPEANQVLIFKNGKWTPSKINSLSLDGQNLTATDGSIEVTDGQGATLINTSIKVADGGITTEKIKAGTYGQVLSTDAQGKVVWKNLKKTTVDNLSGGRNLTAADTSIEVTNGKGATLVNTNVKVADGGITNDKLANDAVTSDKIKNGTIKGEDLDANAVTSKNIKGKDGADGEVLVTKADGTTEWKKLSGDNITGQNLTLGKGLEKTAGELDGALLKAVTIGISDKGVDPTKIKPGAENQIYGQVLTTDGAGTATWVTPKATTADDVTSGHNLSGDTNGGIIVTGGDEVLLKNNASIKIKEGGVTNDMLAGSIAPGKLTPGTDGQVLTTDAQGAVTWKTPVAPNVSDLQNKGALSSGGSIKITENGTSGDGAASLLKNVQIDIAPGTNGQVLTTTGGKATWGPNPAPIGQALTVNNGLEATGTTDTALLQQVSLSVKANSAKAVEVTDAGVGVKTGNGITLDATAGVELGGTLTKDATITTAPDKVLEITAAADGQNTIKFSKLPTETSENFNFVTVDADGQLKKNELPYSSEEKYTGRKWTLGGVDKKVYQKTVEVNFTNATNAPFTIPTGGTIISATMVNKANPTDYYSSVQIKNNEHGEKRIYANTGAMYWELNGAYYVTIEYYK